MEAASRRAARGVPLGHCALSLAPASDPVASPSGHVYSREGALRWMLDRRKALAAQRAAWDEQEAEREARTAAAEHEAHAERVKRFNSANSAVVAPEKRRRDPRADLAELERSRKRDSRSHEEKLADLRHSSPWLTQFTPSAEPTKISKPPKRPGSPFTGGPFKVKDLVPLKFTRDGENNIICPVSRSVITIQPSVLLKPSGVVMLSKSFDAAVKKEDMRCPVTGIKLKPSDVLPLHNVPDAREKTGCQPSERGGTSTSASTVDSVANA